MGRDLKERIRQRVLARMDELSVSGRELAHAVRPKPYTETDEEWTRKLDSWISSILTGRAGLGVEYFDAVCETLRLTPSELVRDDATELRELTPQEMALLRHYRTWPRAVQDRWLKMLDYFTSSTSLEPDKVRLLDEWEVLTPQEQRAVFGYFFGLRRARTQQRAEHDGEPPETAGGSALRDTTHPAGTEQILPGTREPNDDDP